MLRTLTTLFGVLGISGAALALPLEEQREVYAQSQRLLDEKKVEAYHQLRPLIEDYTLTPYLDYRVFLQDITERTPEQVAQFAKDNRTFPFTNSIRGEYLDALVEDENWAFFADYQTDLPRMQSYRCSYYYAKLKTGNTKAAFEGADTLWLSGNSISDKCDGLFEAWTEAGKRTDELILKRMLLAFGSGNSSLLNYLAKLPQGNGATQLADWLKTLNASPNKVLAFVDSHPTTQFNLEVASLAVKKLSVRDTKAAVDALNQIDFSAATKQELSESIAYRLISVEVDDAELINWRDNALASSRSSARLEQRIRLAITQADWSGVHDWIERLPESSYNSLRWQYWLGRAELALGKRKQGEKRLEGLLGQRQFYSAAAAFELDKPIEFTSSVAEVDFAQIERYSEVLERIDELLYLDKISAAKSEWRWLLTRAYNADKPVLAYYAAEQGWHNLTVTATIESKMWSHTALRFPVAHKWQFDFFGQQSEVDPITLMALARQESAFDPLAHSSAGARGLMQVIPSTAEYTAKKYDIRYRSAEQLYSETKNIEIGSFYLKGLYDRFDDNRILAFAAYNAGPKRVSQWQSRSKNTLDPFAFIESIPYKETRGYVQNVLMFETYYRSLLESPAPFLTLNEKELRY